MIEIESKKIERRGDLSKFDVDLPLTRDEQLDEIHRDEVRVLELLLESLKSGSDEDIKEGLMNFIEHIDSHFKHEEELMDVEGYTMVELHKGEHYKILNEVRYLLFNWQNSHDRYEVEDYLKYEFIPWLKQHIPALDQPLIEFLRSKR